MKPLPLLISGLLFLITRICFAGDDQRFIGFECDSKNKSLIISYHADHISWFREGYFVDTNYLKKNDPTGSSHVVSVRTVTKTCTIGQSHYVAKIRGVPGNFHLQGFCGGTTFGGVKVSQNGKTLIDTDFENCDAKTILTHVIFNNESATPKVLIANQEEFWHGRNKGCYENPETKCIPEAFLKPSSHMSR